MFWRRLDPLHTALDSGCSYSQTLSMVLSMALTWGLADAPHEVPSLFKEKV